MKKFGILLIIAGISLLCFVGYLFFKEKNKIASPIPEYEGIKVIVISPTKNP